MEVNSLAILFMASQPAPNIPTTRNKVVITVLFTIGFQWLTSGYTCWYHVILFVDDSFYTT